MCQQSATMAPSQKVPTKKPYFHQWFLGLLISSLFSIAYLTIPFYLLTATLSLLLRYPTTHLSLLYSFPLILSALLPPIPSKFLISTILTPMLHYFDFESIHMNESHIRSQMAQGKSFLFAAQPHGILSYCGMCAAVSNPDDVMIVPTAAASVVLKMPILKHVMGIFNLVDASAGNIARILRQKQKHKKNKTKDDDNGSTAAATTTAAGSCVLIYIGGIAELFKSCRTEERLYLQKRKGFIKLALREGVDVVPIYLFGNTSVLCVWKHGPLAALSRRLQASLTWFWGRWYLPIPRDEKLLYVVGKPIGLPHIAEPTQQDIDKWHGVYCDEVRYIFETYKEKVPMYKHKKLFID